MISQIMLKTFEFHQQEFFLDISDRCAEMQNVANFLFVHP